MPTDPDAKPETGEADAEPRAVAALEPPPVGEPAPEPKAVEAVAEPEPEPEPAISSPAPKPIAPAEPVSRVQEWGLAVVLMAVFAAICFFFMSYLRG